MVDAAVAVLAKALVLPEALVLLEVLAVTVTMAVWAKAGAARAVKRVMRSESCIVR